MQNNYESYVNDFSSDSFIIKVEQEEAYKHLLKSLTKKVTKLNRKQAKDKYLYRKLNGQLKLA